MLLKDQFLYGQL